MPHLSGPHGHWSAWPSGDVETRVDAYVRGQIKGPTMIIHRDKDFLATEAETMEFFGKLRTNYKSYVALPDGGQAILLEKNYKKFQSVVLGFLNQP